MPLAHEGFPNFWLSFRSPVPALGEAGSPPSANVDHTILFSQEIRHSYAGSLVSEWPITSDASCTLDQTGECLAAFCSRCVQDIQLSDLRHTQFS